VAPLAAAAATAATAAKTLKPVETAVAASRESVEAAVEAGKQNMDAVVKAGTEAASKSYDQVVTKTKEQAAQAVALTTENVTKASEAAFKGYDEFALFGKDTFDAMVRTNGIVAKGFEVLGKEILAYTQVSIEENVAQTKALMGAKDLKEVVDLQNDFARGRLDKAIAESAKLTEMSVKVSNEALAPIQKRVDATVQTMLKAHAA
jgi:phasin family protein